MLHVGEITSCRHNVGILSIFALVISGFVEFILIHLFIISMGQFQNGKFYLKIPEEDWGRNERSPNQKYYSTSKMGKL